MTELSNTGHRSCRIGWSIDLADVKKKHSKYDSPHQFSVTGFKNVESVL